MTETEKQYWQDIATDFWKEVEKEAEELEAIGADELFDPRDGISLIEWAQRFEALLPPNAWRVWIHREGEQRWAEVTRPSSHKGHIAR